MKQKKYNIIYADPPWTFRVYSPKGNGRSAAIHYPTMNLEAIKDLPVEQLADIKKYLGIETTGYPAESNH